MTINLPSTCGSGIFRVGHLLHPGRVISIQRFLHRDVDHAIGRRAAVPMLFARRNPDDVAGLDLVYRPALALDPADAGDHIERLAKGVRMPGRPRAWLKGYAGRDNPRRGLGGNDRILPDRAGKILFGREACRPRTGGMDIHGVPPSDADASNTS